MLKLAIAVALSAAGTPAPPVQAPHPGPSVQVDGMPSVSKETIARLQLYRGPSRGPATAPVTIVMFQDNMCPYCEAAFGTIDQLMEEYPGKLRVVVKQFPVHASARLSAEASYAAAAQGKFWEMHDLLLQHQVAREQERDALIQYAQQIGLDVPAFTAALDHHEFARAVASDQAAGKQINFSETPSFLINGRKFIGARPIEQFRATIDQALRD